MNSKLKELIQPYWIEEQQGVYIPLIDKVLLKNNVPEMHYEDYMEYAKSNGVQIATKDELLQMYLQKDEINKILREHNGDMLDTWFGSSSEYGLYYEWCVNFGSGYCYNATKLNYSASRTVVDLKSKKTNNMKQFNLEEYKKNPNRRVITRDGKSVRIVCTDIIMWPPSWTMDSVSILSSTSGSASGGGIMRQSQNMLWKSRGNTSRRSRSSNKR